MSWIVQNLLRNSYRIKERGKEQTLYTGLSWTVQSLDEELLRGVEDSVISSEQFNDLIMVDKAIKDLHNAGQLDDKDISLLDYVRQGYSLSDAHEFLGIKTTMAYRKLKLICNSIAQYLGGYFTDDGYLNYMQEEYRLTDLDIKGLRNYITGKSKNKILRKSINV